MVVVDTVSKCGSKFKARIGFVLTLVVLNDSLHSQSAILLIQDFYATYYMNNNNKKYKFYFILIFIRKKLMKSKTRLKTAFAFTRIFGNILFIVKSKCYFIRSLKWKITLSSAVLYNCLCWWISLTPKFISH